VQAGDVVSLRVSTPEGPTEVVGTLVAASADALSVRRRDGTVVEVAVDDVRAGRVVPPGPARTIGADELQTVMAAGWRAPEVAQVGPWQLRAAGGFTGRANSVLVPGDPAEDLPGLLDQVEQWYADRSLPPRLQVVSGGEPPGLLDELVRRGWQPSPLTHVMTAEAAHVIRGRRDDVGVALDASPGQDWLGLYRRGEGGLPAAATQVLTNHPSVVFASVREGGQCVAVARTAVDGRWAGVFAVEVDPTRRREGLGSAVSLASVRWAIANGARRVYLQVRSDNDAAVRMYEQLGFAHHHDYVYWTCSVEE
jgi:ribosomal protein S18 acetylase RimI-like enzyme